MSLTDHDALFLLLSRQQLWCNCYCLWMQTWLLFWMTWQQRLRFSVNKLFQLPLGEEFAESMQGVGRKSWSDLRNTASTTTLIAQRLILACEKHTEDLTSKHWQSTLLRLWLCQSFKNSFTSLFYLYLPVLVCTRVIHDNNVRINVSNKFFKKNLFNNALSYNLIFLILH